MRARPLTRDVVGLVLATAIVCACSRGDRLPRKTHLGRLPAKVETIAISDEATSYAYLEQRENQVALVRDGVAVETFRRLLAPTFSPGAQKLFYWAASENTGHLVADGKRIGGDFGREGTLVFTPDGRRWATTCGARDENGTRPGSAIVLADGEELGRYPDASAPTFSPDGRHLAYLAAVEGGGTRLIVDGAERGFYGVPQDECAARAKPHNRRGPNFWPQFQAKYLSDGSLLVMTQDPDGWGIYRSGERVASYPASLVQANPTLSDECADLSAIAAWSLTVAEKAPVAAWWERPPGRDQPWRVVVNGRPADSVVCVSPWLRQPPELSPDGQHIAYACAVKEPAERVFLVADGQRLGPYVELWGYTWDDEGAHVAYGALDGPIDRPWRYYVDGEPRTDHFLLVWRPRLEPGTGRLAWEAVPEPDGRMVLGVDRRRIATFDEVVWGPTFLRRGVVTWVVRRGRSLSRIDVPTR